MICVLVLIAATAVADSQANEGRATGGPDAFGYTYFDQVDGCSYSWIDRAGALPYVDGTNQSAVIPLGGSGFDVYGTPIDHLTASTNGYLSTSLSDTGDDSTNDCPLPVVPSSGGGARIYAVHDSLSTTVYHQYFSVCPRSHDIAGSAAMGCNVFWWDGVSVGGFSRSQAILYDRVYEIVVQIQIEESHGATSTTGLQNDGATDGLTYVCDTDGSVNTGVAVCFAHPDPVPVELLRFWVE